MKRKWTFAACLALSGALALSACSGQIATRDNPGPAASGQVNSAGTDALIEGFGELSGRFRKSV